ncbi:LCP family protein [Pseudonocardia sp. CA-107938]|uniref:LCP family protein n=1 Tax=Pseudonocardia sp. CA-107938 TaxID=3240021 RepID=UPI003D8FC86A
MDDDAARPPRRPDTGVREPDPWPRRSERGRHDPRATRNGTPPSMAARGSDRGPDERLAGPLRRRPDQPGRPADPPRRPAPPAVPPGAEPATRPVGPPPPRRPDPRTSESRPAGRSGGPPPPGRAAPVRVEPATRPVTRTPAPRTEAPDTRTEMVPTVKGRADAPDVRTEMVATVDGTDDESPPTARVVSPAATRRPTPKRHGRPTKQRTLKSALLATAAATVVPGSGHLMLGRRRTGTLIVGVFALLVLAMVLLATTASRTTLLSNLLSARVLIVIGVGIVAAAVAWIAVIVRTYLIARPRSLAAGPQAVGVLVTAALCLVVAAPFGYAANLANAQRNFLDTLFAGDKGGTSAAEAIAKPRLNVLLVGSDAGPDREGARTDSMMVASIDTRTGRTTIFGLPRNLGHVQFPPGTPMAKKFPDGFHDASNPLSGDYLLNAVYAWGRDHHADAPTTPTADPGLNLLHETVSYMLGLQLDYYVEVNMAGFAAIVDALGGLQVDTGPNPIPVGGIQPDGTHVKPDRYIPAGPQLLNGEDALAYARSRTDSTDYTRMGRQRCLLQKLLTQKSPAQMLTNFQAVASATTNSVATNIPQEVLPSLVALAGQPTVKLESIAFDPSLVDPSRPDGKFSTARVDVDFMREVVQRAISGQPLPSLDEAKSTAKPRASRSATAPTAPSTTEAPQTSPVSLADACG